MRRDLLNSKGHVQDEKKMLESLQQNVQDILNSTNVAHTYIDQSNPNPPPEIKPSPSITAIHTLIHSYRLYDP